MKALLIIDVQNDYFSTGAFPQHQTEELAVKISNYAKNAEKNGHLIIIVQHLLPENAPMFARGSKGAEVHQTLTHFKNAIWVEKVHADAFLNTNLLTILENNQINKMEICGIMTQNCVTHTALSPFAQNYQIKVLSELCTAPTELIHQIALNALKDRDWIEVI